MCCFPPSLQDNLQKSTQMIKGGTILVREQDDLSNLLLKTFVVGNRPQDIV